MVKEPHKREAGTPKRRETILKSTRPVSESPRRTRRSQRLHQGAGAARQSRIDQFWTLVPHKKTDIEKAGRVLQNSPQKTPDPAAEKENKKSETIQVEGYSESTDRGPQDETGLGRRPTPPVLHRSPE